VRVVATDGAVEDWDTAEEVGEGRDLFAHGRDDDRDGLLLH
jgi:hypothetical protein